MITIEYPDADWFAYLYVDHGVFGPINNYVFGAPNSSTGRVEIRTDDSIVTTPGIMGENHCDHVKTVGTLLALPDLVGTTHSDTSGGYGYFKWSKGYTSGYFSSVQYGPVMDYECPSVMIGAGGSDNDIWRDAKGNPYFIGCIGSSQNGTVVHTFSLSGKPQYSGSTRLNYLLNYTHRIYDLTTFRNDYGGQYFVDFDEWSTANRVLPFDLMDKPDVFASYAHIESDLALPKGRSTQKVGLLWKGNTLPRGVSGYSSIISSSLSGSARDFSTTLKLKSFSELSAEAVASARFTETNVIGFIRDLRHPTELIPKLKNLKYLKNLKGASSEYLRYKYGVLPTVSDVESIWLGFNKVQYQDREGNRVLTAGHTLSAVNGNMSTTGTKRLKIVTAREDNAIHIIYQNMVNIGVFPTLANIWDLIPYSFVIDWLVDVGSFLERIDRKAYYSTLNVIYATTSQKYVTNIRIVANSACPLSGTITIKEYHRRVSNQSPAPALSGPITTNGFNHYAEAGALILQRTH